MVILHKLIFFMWRGYSFDDVCSMDVEAQNLTQCWMNHEDHENIQNFRDIHKLPLHIAIDSQNICVKVYFIRWQEQFLQDGKNNQNHHDLFYFTTA